MKTYEKPDIEKVCLKQERAIIAGPEYSESWSGSSCFAKCRTKGRRKQTQKKEAANQLMLV